MRCSQIIEVLGYNISLNNASRGWQAARAYSESSAQEAIATSVDIPIYAACVLQRLPILRPAVPPHHAQQLIWSRQRGLETGEYKDYPESATKGRGDAGSKQEKQDLRTFTPVPSVTSADTSGEVRSMRRQLSEALYLVVRSQGGRQGDVQAQAQAQAQEQEQKEGKGIGPSPATPGAADPGGCDIGGTWGFPVAANAGEESISDTAQRALHSVIGRSHPVFFVGKAPMAHLTAPQRRGKTFFMLAQAVDDPWGLRIVEGSPAKDYAWVTKQELLSTYLSDARLRELIRKML
ncbi:hypothetical protein VaNZ11_013777 [Volvox africanus]|uniref:Ribosomal protein L46 N-terminal domain-containing protein n=1 Tax=Volvox africanus TaxID=51714 RepID=A0ABQ5SHR7_9CHLO|nr:hypothetical protein VaNZ11_013777 [Volvox africanus]